MKATTIQGAVGISQLISIRRLKKRLMSRRERLFSWLFLLLPLAIIVRVTIFVRQRQGSGFAEIDETAFVQILIVGLCGLLLLVAPKRKRIFGQMFRTSMGLLTIYYLFAMVSVTWSPLPLYTAYRAIEFLVLSIAIFFSFYYIRDPLQWEKRGLYTAVVIMLLGVAMQVKLGGLSLQSLHTNSYSAVAAMILVYCLAEYMGNSAGRRKIMLRNIGLFSLLILVVGTSSASNLAALGGILLISLLSRNKILLAITVIVGLTGALLMTSEDIIALLFPGKSMTQIESGHGRTWLWTMIAEEILESPLVGNGFAAATRTMEHYTTNTHNGYLGVLMGTGFVGGVIFLLFMRRVLLEGLTLWRSSDRRGMGSFIALSVMFANNMSLSIIGESWIPSGMVAVVFLSMQIQFVRLDRFYRNRYRDNANSPKKNQKKSGKHTI